MCQPLEECTGHQVVALERPSAPLVDIPVPISRIAYGRKAIAEAVSLFELWSDYHDPILVRIPVQSFDLDLGKTLVKPFGVIELRRNDQHAGLVDKTRCAADTHRGKSLREVPSGVVALGQDTSLSIRVGELAWWILLACLAEWIVRCTILCPREDGIRKAASTLRVECAWPLHHDSCHPVRKVFAV